MSRRFWEGPGLCLLAGPWGPWSPCSPCLSSGPTGLSAHCGAHLKRTKSADVAPALHSIRLLRDLNKKPTFACKSMGARLRGWRRLRGVTLKKISSHAVGAGVMPQRVVWIMARHQLLQFMLYVRGRHTLHEWPPSKVHAELQAANRFFANACLTIFNTCDDNTYILAEAPDHQDSRPWGSVAVLSCFSPESKAEACSCARSHVSTSRDLSAPADHLQSLESRLALRAGQMPHRWPCLGGAHRYTGIQLALTVSIFIWHHPIPPQVQTPIFQSCLHIICSMRIPF